MLSSIDISREGFPRLRYYGGACLDRDTLLIYLAIIVVLILSIVLFNVTGISNDPMFFRWAILYYGSAVVQAYATIIAVPFTIWVIYMQSRYGYLMIRLFTNRVIYPFIILGVISIITALTMSFEETSYAYYAFLVEYSASLLLLPPIILYIRELMTMGPEKLVRIIRSLAREPGEAVATSLHILRLVLMEEYPEEKVINNILKIIREDLRNIEKIKLNPDTYHKFRDFLRAVVVEGTYLPDPRVLRDVMRSMLRWVVLNKKFSVARAFIRYYTRITLRYMDEILPSFCVYNLYLEPVINNLKSIKARKSLLGYALEQLSNMMRKVRVRGEHGDISSYEICNIARLVEENVADLKDLKEHEKLHRILNEIKGEFLCMPIQE